MFGAKNKKFYFDDYFSPLGHLMMVSNGEKLCGLYFEDMQRPKICGTKRENLTVFKLTKKWLDVYFKGQNPNFLPPLLLEGRSFEMFVWKELLKIGFGQTTTYGQIARKADKENMSAQAVGQAVKRNPIVLIVPCHRVVGAKGVLTGYAGGIERKQKLLELEMQANQTQRKMC